VSALARALEAEIPPFMPDYLHGHRICWTFFRRVKDAIESDMLRWLGPEWITKEYQLPFAAGYILRSLCGDEKLPPTHDLLDKATASYKEALYPDNDTGSEPRSEVCNKIKELQAIATLRKVEPEPERGAQSQPARQVRALQDSSSNNNKNNGQHINRVQQSRRNQRANQARGGGRGGPGGAGGRRGGGAGGGGEPGTAFELLLNSLLPEEDTVLTTLRFPRNSQGTRTMEVERRVLDIFDD